MVPTYHPLTPGDRDAVADFLTSDTWPFHVGVTPSREQALSRFDGGDFIGDDVRSYWMRLEGEPIGLLMITDLDDETPMLDLRLRTAHRGRGLGQAALRWMTETIFETWPHVDRIEGQTREDNTAMRRTFRKLGYVKEAHYRAAWPNPNGRKLASIGYGLLRSDWEAGTTTEVRWDDE